MCRCSRARVTGATTRTTRSTGGSSCCTVLNRSLITRLIRFRALARATAFLPTMRPSRAWCILLKTRLRRNGPDLSRPSGRRRTCSYSRARVSLRLREKLRSLAGALCSEGRTARGAGAGRGSDAQALAALGTSGVQNFTPTFGRHSGTEAVSALALQIARLKGSLHSRASELRVLKGAAILGRGHEAVNFCSVRCHPGFGVVLGDRLPAGISIRNYRYLRLVGCCLLAARGTVDKGGFGLRLNDLALANVCAKPHEQAGVILWARWGKNALQK